MNKKLTYSFLCICLSVSCNLLWAQVDTTKIKESEFNAVTVTGTKKILFDPALRPRIEISGGFQSLGQALQQQNIIFLKSYGPGLLSSISARGTDPTHTPILWNGFTLQNTVNANPDPSIENIPSYYSASYYAGGQSGLYGSGAMGGTIHLGQSFLQPIGVAASTGIEAGSFGRHSELFNLSYKSDSTIISIGVKIFKSKNDFPFINRTIIEKPTQRLPHAEAYSSSFNADFKQIIGKFGTITASVWYQFNRRQIPPTMITSVGNAEQIDENVRSMISWEKSIKGVHNLSLKTAFLYDYLFYNDNALITPSLMVQYASLTRAEYNFTFLKNHAFLAGLNHAYYKVFMEEYHGFSPQRNQSTLFVGYKYVLPKRLGEISLQAVEELTDGKLTPFCPAFSALLKPLPYLPIRIRVNRNYRQPTFNDLYWVPGGNIHLKPEQGFSQELGVGLSFRFRKDPNDTEKNLELFFTGFHNIITNRIAWIPGPVFWAPENIDKTRAYGAEVDLKFYQKIGKDWRIRANANYSFTKSVRAKERFTGDPAFKKQLIYIPMQLAGGTITISYKKTSIYYNHRYTGKRYTLTDNSKAIPGFNVGKIGISQEVKIYAIQGIIWFACDNIANVQYEVLEYRPMPGRNFLVGINLSFNKKVK